MEKLKRKLTFKIIIVNLTKLPVTISNESFAASQKSYPVRATLFYLI